MLKQFTNTNKKQKIALGMSGGVDSTMAIVHLQQSGYEVIGFTFLFVKSSVLGEELPSFAQEAIRLAKVFNIAHYVIDASDDFEKTILKNFCSEYVNGRTPFPCALCNRELKWNKLHEQMLLHGCNKMATGHYAQIIDSDGKKYIQAHSDVQKDQSFFLWGIPNHFLKDILFPLQNVSKVEVKQLAATYNLPSLAEKQESFGVCFAPDGNYVRFLADYLPNFNQQVVPGNFISAGGQILGRHKGIVYYTVGQRKGLEISSKTPLFVKHIDAEKNQIVLGEFSDIALSNIYLADFVVHDPSVLDNERLEIRIRYRGQQNFGCLSISQNILKIHLEKPETAIAPGQTAVLYKQGIVVGGGFILRAD